MVFETSLTVDFEIDKGGGMGLGFNTAGVVDLEFDTGGCIDLGFIIGVIELQLETPAVEVLQTGDESSLEDAFTRWLLPEATTE